ncbi:hypothetical protein QBC32DRAFT_382617 [Pseudoneurospora amorphoporcata]|uniref:C2H2-type domain-containing protein n=1 Tax=Pseudoneurospora amorphoporcata TaxID=241081 RepID=A0AAN6SBA8_9PEZI|nr:hypothetical protein QBC32DRAFT_382617 [Pseudoneurospora amorphoporcata]
MVEADAESWPKPSSPVASAPGTPPVETQSASSTHGQDDVATPVTAASRVPSSSPAPVSPAAADTTGAPPSPSHMRSPDSDWVTTNSSPSPKPTKSPSPDSNAASGPVAGPSGNPASYPYPRAHPGSSHAQPHPTCQPGEEQQQQCEQSPSPSPWPESPNSNASQRAPSCAAPPLPPGFLFTPTPAGPPPGTGLYILTSAPHPYPDPPITLYPPPQAYPATHLQFHPSHQPPPAPLAPHPQAQASAEAQAEALYKQIYRHGYGQAHTSHHLPPVYIHEAQPPPPVPMPAPGRSPEFDAPFGFYRSPGKNPTVPPKPKFYPPSSKPLFLPKARVTSSPNEPRWWAIAQSTGEHPQSQGQQQGQPQAERQSPFHGEPQPQGPVQFHGQPQYLIGFGQPRGRAPAKPKEKPIKIIHHEPPPPPPPRPKQLQQLPPPYLPPHLQAQAEAEAEARYKEIYGPRHSQAALQRKAQAQAQAEAYSQASARQWKHIFRPLPALQQHTQAYAQNQPPQLLAPSQVPAYQIHGLPYGQNAGAGYQGQYSLPINSLGSGERRYQCDFLDCTRSFARNHDLNRHRRSHYPDMSFGCEKCGKRFTRRDALRRHVSVAAKCGGDPNNPVEISSSPSPAPPEEATGNSNGAPSVPSATRNGSINRARSPSVLSDMERNRDQPSTSARKRNRCQEPEDGDGPEYDRDYRPHANTQGVNQAGSSPIRQSQRQRTDPSDHKQRQKGLQNRWIIGTSANDGTAAETEAEAAVPDASDKNIGAASGACPRHE